MIKVQARGGRATEDTLARMAPKAALALTRSTVGALASEVLITARRGMPRKTGKMRRLTKKQTRRVRNGIVQVDIVVSKKAFYWYFFERGLGNVRRRRMFAKALNQMGAVLPERWEYLFMQRLQARMVRERNRKLRGLR